MERTVDVAIGIVLNHGLVLVCQRPAHAAFPGCWEFPGGKVEPGETLQQCLARELLEEVGVTAEVYAALSPVDHAYPSGRVRLHPYLCTLIDGVARPLAAQQLKWVTPAQLRDCCFPPANERLIDEVIDRLSAAPDR